MSIQEIEQAITELDNSELAELAEWFANLHMEKWDAQIAEDSRSGKLDAMIARAQADFEAGKFRTI